MENLFLVLRVVVSLAVVLGLLYVLRRKLLPRSGGGQRRQIAVVARQGVGPKTSVALIDVAGRRYLLGVGDQTVSVLDSYAAPAPEDEDDDNNDNGGRLFALNLDDARQRGPRKPAAPHPDAAEMPDDPQAMTVPAAPVTRRELRSAGTPGQAAHGSAQASALAGSILSAQTWRQAAAAWRRGPS